MRPNSRLLLFCFSLLCSASLQAQSCYPPSLDHGDPKDLFGNSVTLNGDHAAVLASGDQAVYVYRREAGNWRRTARILLPPVSNPLSSDATWISASGDELLVGSPVADVGAVSRAGVVHHYRLQAGSWQLSASLSASEPQSEAYFGGRLTLSDEFLVIGSHTFDQPGTSNSGAAYVYRRAPDGSFGTPVALADPTPSNNGRFGFALAASAGRVIIGAGGDTEAGVQLAGSAHVFSLADSPQLLQTLQQPNITALAQFGSSVSADGARLLISNNLSAGAAAFTYTWNGAIYVAGATPTLGLIGSELIQDTALEGDTALLGIIPIGAGVGVNERVLVLDLTNNQVRSIAGPNTGPGLDAAPSFAGSLAFAGDTMLAGAAGTDVGAGRDQGVAWLYNLGSGSVIRRLRHGGGRAPAEFGASIASAADGRIWVGEPGYDGSREDVGRVLELIADGDGWLPGRSAVSPSAQEGFGARVALSGDLLVIGSDRAQVGSQPGYGRVHVQRIGPSEVQPVCELTPPANPELFPFGNALAISGNRVAVTHGPAGNRRIHVYEVGTSCQVITTITATSLGTPNSTAFASSLAFVGEQLAIGNPRFAPPTALGQVLILKPQEQSYLLLTTLSQTGSPTTTGLMGQALTATSDHLVALRPPVTLNGTPRAGAVLIWRREADTYTLVATTLDPSVPGSIEWSGFGQPLLTGTQLLTSSRDSLGRGSFLQLSLDQASQFTVGTAFAEQGNITALFATGDRIGAGSSTTGNMQVAWRGSVRTKRVTGGSFSSLPELAGSVAELIHCADFSEVED